MLKTNIYGKNQPIILGINYLLFQYVSDMMDVDMTILEIGNYFRLSIDNSQKLDKWNKCYSKFASMKAVILLKLLLL